MNKKIRQRMIRTMCLIISLACFVSFMTVSASAAESIAPIIDLFDYNTMRAYGVNPSVSVPFSLPGSATMNYFDAIIGFSGTPVSFSITYGTRTRDLSFKLIDASLGLYRVYGSLTGHSSDSFTFNATASTSSGNSVTFKSARLFTLSSSSFHCSATGTFYDMYSSTNTSLSYTGSVVQVYGSLPNNGTLETTCILSLAPVDYERFDYVDFLIYFSNVQIDSISATYNGMTLPLEVSYIYPDQGLQSCFYINVRMDLSECKWVSGTFPSFDVTGNFSPGQSYVVSVNDCTGIIVSQLYDPIIYYFRQIASKIDTFRTNVSSWITDQTTSLSYWLEQIYMAVAGESSEDNPGDTLVNQGQQIQEFEQGHQAVINEGTQVMMDTLNISGFAPALLFVSSTLDGVFDILGPYQVVIIIPVVLGMILFICSKVPGNSQPPPKSYDPRTDFDHSLQRGMVDKSKFKSRKKG